MVEYVIIDMPIIYIYNLSRLLALIKLWRFVGSLFI